MGEMGGWAKTNTSDEYRDAVASGGLVLPGWGADTSRYNLPQCPCVEGPVLPVQAVPLRLRRAAQPVVRARGLCEEEPSSPHRLDEE